MLIKDLAKQAIEIMKNNQNFLTDSARKTALAKLEGLLSENQSDQNIINGFKAAKEFVLKNGIFGPRGPQKSTFISTINSFLNEVEKSEADKKPLYNKNKSFFDKISDAEENLPSNSVPNYILVATNPKLPTTSQIIEDLDKTQMPGNKPTDIFPIEIWKEVFSYLLPDEVLPIQKVCTDFMRFFRDKNLQKIILNNIPKINKAFVGLNIEGVNSRMFYLTEENSSLLLHWQGKEEGITIPKSEIDIRHNAAFLSVKESIKKHWASSWGDVEQFFSEGNSSAQQLEKDIKLKKENLPEDIRYFLEVFNSYKGVFSSETRKKLIQRFNEFKDKYSNQTRIHGSIRNLYVSILSYDNNKLEITIENHAFNNATRLTISREDTKDIAKIYQDCLKEETAAKEMLKNNPSM